VVVVAVGYSGGVGGRRGAEKWRNLSKRRDWNRWIFTIDGPTDAASYVEIGGWGEFDQTVND